MTEAELKQQLTAAEEQSKERATKAAERIKNYQRQASLDLEAMTQLRVELHAADEQLAEMREALEQARSEAGKPYYDEQSSVACVNIIAIVDKALSAAPKRGRVLFKGTGRLFITEDKGIVDSTVGGEPGGWMFTIDERLDVKKDAQSVTVTVREAE